MERIQMPSPDIHTGWHVDFYKIKRLIESGVDPNIKYDVHQYTLLHWAVCDNNLGVVEYLIDKGADVNVENSHGNTSLHIAAGREFMQIVVYLLDNGAHKDHRNKYGDTATEHARYNREIVGFIESYEWIPVKGVHCDG